MKGNIGSDTDCLGFICCILPLKKKIILVKGRGEKKCCMDIAPLAANRCIFFKKYLFTIVHLSKRIHAGFCHRNVSYPFLALIAWKITQNLENKLSLRISRMSVETVLLEPRLKTKNNLTAQQQFWSKMKINIQSTKH